MSYRHPSGVRTMYGSAPTAGAGPDPCTPISPSSCRNTDPPNPTMACTPPGQPRHGQTIHAIGMVARDLLEWRPKRVVNGPRLVALVRALWCGPGSTNDPFGAPNLSSVEPKPAGRRPGRVD